MTNISKKQTGAIDYRVAQKQLITLLAKIERNTAQHFINELLTEAEKVMLIKRFAAIFMFQDNYSPYRISQTIGISETTALRISKHFKTGKYNNLIATMPKKQRSEFLQLVQDFVFSRISIGARNRLQRRLMKR
jgi:uncharacterized protein YerC